VTRSLDSEGTTYDAPSAVANDEGPRALVLVVGGGAIALPRGLDVTVGRSRSCDVRVEDVAASRLHLTLRWAGERTVTLVDHGSRNGTLVDGTRVSGTLAAPSGSEIAIGAVRLIVAVIGPVAAPSEGSPGEESEGSPGEESEGGQAEALTDSSEEATSAHVASTAGRADLVPIDDALLVARDQATLRALALAERAARSEVTVLVLGETGVGKEILARRIHAESRRSGGPFVGVNCAAIPETLAEATLFGHERGAFTGAYARRPGCFEAANGGTLFLDEVAELSPAMQARLLRTLQERVVVRVGSHAPIPVDVRVVAATNENVDAAVERGALRRDLLYRLDVLRIVVPPLRARLGDILPLAQRFVRELAEGTPPTLSEAAVRALCAHSWPGNVRELRNVMARALVLREGAIIEPVHLALREADPAPGVAPSALRSRLDDLEREALEAALAASAGNQTRAARRLGISRRALIYKLEKFGLKEPPRTREPDHRGDT